MAIAPDGDRDVDESRDCPGSLMGVTALLDELLAEGAVHGENAPELEIVGVACPRLEEDPEAAAELMRQAQELSDLSAEVDACLASLEDWKEEREQQKEALQRELEELEGRVDQCYSGDVVIESSVEYEEDDTAPDAEAVTEVPANISPAQAGLFAEARTGAGLWAVKGVSAAPAPMPVSDEQLRADEARLAKLREEVEELKQQGVRMEAERRLAEAAALDASVCGDAHSASILSGLNDWCAEVDAALGLPQASLDDSVAPAHQELESQLVDVWAEGERLENALGAARGRVDLELGELERLLAECDALHAKVGYTPHPTPVTAVAPPVA